MRFLEAEEFMSAATSGSHLPAPHAVLVLRGVPADDACKDLAASPNKTSAKHRGSSAKET